MNHKVLFSSANYRQSNAAKIFVSTQTAPCFPPESMTFTSVRVQDVLVPSLCTCLSPDCIFNQQQRPGIILITLASPGIYSSLFHCCSGRPDGRVQRIHGKFAHLAVAGDMDSDSTQLAPSPPLSSLILAGGDLARLTSLERLFGLAPVVFLLPRLPYPNF